MRSVVAAVTCLTFTLMVAWPERAHAQATQPPPPGATNAAPATPPPADDASLQQAKQHFEAGRNAYNGGDYQGAIGEFKQAEALRASPILDYNIGLANEKLGKRRVAVKYYKRYLEQQPDAANRAEVEGRISTLETAIAAQPGGGAPEAQDQVSDMPPADPNAPPAQPGYDPYAAPPPGGPHAVVVKKKHNLWWLWIVIPCAVALTVTIVALAVVYGDTSSNTVTYYDLKTSGALDKQRQPDFHGLTVLRF